ncbi:MAG: HAD family hydrolase [Chitinophagaceae bacterium]|nr:HAD family hydrolase [Chitinophagaceae bacterium]
MKLETNSKSFFIFDLDDTLFSELDFLKSAYSNISSKLAVTLNLDIYEQMMNKYQNKENVFEWLIEKYQSLAPFLTFKWLLKEYREHLPDIRLNEDASAFIQTAYSLNIPMGVITDGRSITQRNKLKALNIAGYFQDIIISEEFGSEKPDERNYLYFQNKYNGMNFHFFGDNTSKDFIVPAKLGWTTICLKNTGNNIHAQSLISEPIPDHVVSSFGEINLSKS